MMKKEGKINESTKRGQVIALGYKNVEIFKMQNSIYLMIVQCCKKLFCFPRLDLL